VQRDPEKEEARLIQRCLSPVAGNVLEIGCGDGRLTADLGRVADNLLAADPFVEELRSARRRVEIPAAFIATSGESLPLAANSFDTVAFTLSLHHQESRKALAEACRVLKGGGRILILEPVADSLVSRLFAVLDDESEKYALAERAIENSGLKVLRSGAVAIRWVFEDFAEMVRHLFDYFGLEPEREKENVMAQLLGDRRKLSPLPVEDVTRFWLLRQR
jgi:ubiquinone/menaquinone biosynthesis C-methylase UbiE